MPFCDDTPMTADAWARVTRSRPARTRVGGSGLGNDPQLKAMPDAYPGCTEGMHGTAVTGEPAGGYRLLKAEMRRGSMRPSLFDALRTAPGSAVLRV